MRSILTTLFLVGAVLFDCPALACSCGPRGSVESALQNATVVVLAQLVSSVQHSTADNADVRAITEEATFRVIETFKGGLRSGDLLAIRSNLGPMGPCGISAKNSPVWLEMAKNGKSVATHLSGRWVIYGQGKGPFELDMCSHSAPIESGGAYELHRLRVLTKHAKTMSNPAAP